jgi:hypothetical protein
MQTVASDVSRKIEEYNESSKATASDNELLRLQVEKLTKTMELMQQQHDAALRAKDLEKQLAEAHTAQAQHTIGKTEVMVCCGHCRFAYMWRCLWPPCYAKCSSRRCKT